MKPKTLYLILCALGIVLPYSQFLPWLVAHRFDMSLLVRELFANRIGGFFGMDVLVSALVLLAFAATESRRKRIPRLWLVVLALLSFGVSLALPLFLYLRERQLEQSAFKTATC